MKKAFLLKTDGTKKEIVPKNKKDFKYEELTEILPGMTFFFQGLPSGRMMVGDDNGKLMDEPVVNELASDIWRKEFPIEEYPYNNDGIICGDVIVCDRGMIK